MKYLLSFFLSSVFLMASPFYEEVSFKTTKDNFDLSSYKQDNSKFLDDFLVYEKETTFLDEPMKNYITFNEDGRVDKFFFYSKTNSIDIDNLLKPIEGFNYVRTRIEFGSKVFNFTNEFDKIKETYQFIKQHLSESEGEVEIMVSFLKKEDNVENIPVLNKNITCQSTIKKDGCSTCEYLEGKNLNLSCEKLFFFQKIM